MAVREFPNSAGIRRLVFLSKRVIELWIADYGPTDPASTRRVGARRAFAEHRWRASRRAPTKSFSWQYTAYDLPPNSTLATSSLIRCAHSWPLCAAAPARTGRGGSFVVPSSAHNKSSSSLPFSASLSLDTYRTRSALQSENARPLSRPLELLTVGTRSLSASPSARNGLYGASHYQQIIGRQSVESHSRRFSLCRLMYAFAN